MAILKATVRFKNKRGLYPVYIRFTQVKQVAYAKTSWVVNDISSPNSQYKKQDTNPGKQESLLLPTSQKYGQSSNGNLQKDRKGLAKLLSTEYFASIIKKTAHNDTPFMEYA